MGRTPLSPDPSMGLPPGWRVSDLPPSYSTASVVQVATAVNITSAAFNPHANSIQIIPRFSDGVTSCDIQLFNDDGTGNFVLVATWKQINLFTSSSVSFGEYPQDLTLGGRSIQIGVANITGGGSVSIGVLRLG
jgi:hypothetical protein